MTDRLEELRNATELLNIPDEQHVFRLMEWAIEEIERLRAENKTLHKRIGDGELCSCCNENDCDCMESIR